MGTFYRMEPLRKPEYQPLNKISRSLHFDDVQDAHKRNGLVSQPIGNTRIHSLKQLKVLWFAPAKSMDENNFYGNISYVIDWSEVLEEFGPYMYVIDQAIHSNKSFSRILLTNVRHRNLNEITKNMLKEHGWPIMKYHSGEYFHANRSLCNRVLGEHELQIGIQHTKRNKAQRRLFQLCSEIPNDHSDVNVLRYNHQNLGKNYQSYKCYKYNTAKNLECPYAFDKNEAENYLILITGSSFTEQQRNEDDYHYEPSNNPVSSRISSDTTLLINTEEDEESQITGTSFPEQQRNEDDYLYDSSNNDVSSRRNSNSPLLIINDEDEEGQITRSSFPEQQRNEDGYHYEPSNNPISSRRNSLTTRIISNDEVEERRVKIVLALLILSCLVIFLLFYIFNAIFSSYF